MKEQFTSGPWKVMYSTDLEKLCCLAVWPSKTSEGTIGNPICKISPEESESKEDHANAHLIAAAPDMYEALKNIMEAVRRGYDSLSEWITEQEITVLDQAQAALSKANPQ